MNCENLILNCEKTEREREREREGERERERGASIELNWAVVITDPEGGQGSVESW